MEYYSTLHFYIHVYSFLYFCVGLNSSKTYYLRADQSHRQTTPLSFKLNNDTPTNTNRLVTAIT